jgi:hypothetical protein
MSLINAAHFVAPLRSKASIVVLVGGAILVGVMRFASTGAVEGRAQPSPSTTSSSRGAQPPPLSADPEIESYLKSRSHARSRDSIVGDTTVEDLLNPSERTVAKPRIQEDEDTPGAQPQKLNDIKRSLGLN